MKSNIGTIDRIARIIAGLAMIGAGIYFKSWLGIIGLVPLSTAIFGICPAYMPLGLSTCKVEKVD